MRVWGRFALNFRFASPSKCCWGCKETTIREEGRKRKPGQKRTFLPSSLTVFSLHAHGDVPFVSFADISPHCGESLFPFTLLPTLSVFGWCTPPCFFHLKMKTQLYFSLRVPLSIPLFFSLKREEKFQPVKNEQRG